jgi:hypothetical protein
MASFIDPFPAATGATGAIRPAVAAPGLGSDTRLASARASEVPKTVIHPFIGTSTTPARAERAESWDFLWLPY